MHAYYIPQNKNPYAEQNAKVVGGPFLEDVAANRPLPGITKPACEWHAPLDVLLSISRRAYKDENDGWTKIVRKGKRKIHSGGWAGSAAPNSYA